MMSDGISVNERLLSVVTVAYNCCDDLARTIESVTSQINAAFEYIVVDGGSSDGSRQLLEASNRVDRWVSQPDRGIYDAMNKGVAIARGKWICFMNAGDRFGDPNSVAIALQCLASTQPHILIGDAIVYYADGSHRVWRSRSPDGLPRGMVASHQATYARRDDLLRLPFRIGRSASDFEFLLTLWREGAIFQRVDAILARVAAHGLSDVRRIRSVCERWTILRACGIGDRKLHAYYAAAIMRAAISSLALRWLSPRITRRFRRRVC